MKNNFISIESLISKKVIKIVSPSFKVPTSKVENEGDTVIISQDYRFSLGFCDKSDPKLCNPPYIIFGDHTETIKWVDINFVQGADGIKIFKVLDEKILNPLYFYYSLIFYYHKTGFYERHFSNMKLTKIPLLPIETQNKIADALKRYDTIIDLNKKRINLIESQSLETYCYFIDRKKSINVKPVSIQNFLNDEFSGGWGTDEHKDGLCGAHVIRGTDIEKILNSEFNSVPYRFHKPNEVIKKGLKPLDIIFEISNGNIMNVGRNLIITESLLHNFEKVISASFCRVFRPKNKSAATSLYFGINYMIKSGDLDYFKKIGTNGINNFNLSLFSKSTLFELDENESNLLWKSIMLISDMRQEILLINNQKNMVMEQIFVDLLLY